MVCPVRTRDSRRRLTIGEYPAMSLSAARTEALRVRSMVAQGHDPKSASDAAPRVSDAVEEFITKEVSQLAPSSRKSYGTFLRNELVARYGHLNLSRLTDRHLANMIDEIQTSGRTATASGTFRVVRRFLNWAQRTRRYIDTNPASLLAEPKPVKARERVLTDAEIASIHDVLGDDPGSIMVRLLFLTACRLNEVAHMRWADVDLESGLWVIPHTKNGLAHSVPLSSEALTILKTLRQSEIEIGNFVISGSGGSAPYSGFSKLKARIDRKSKTTDWRFHDIRRTAATIMRRAGIGRDVVKAALNHTVNDVTHVYDRYDMRVEKSDGLQLLSEEISRIRSGIGQHYEPITPSSIAISSQS